MKKILFLTTSVTVLLLTAKTALAQKKNQVEGVWKIVQVIISGKDSTTTVDDPQPGLFIFTKNYYSVLAVRERKPRATVEPSKDPQNLTNSEKIARYDSWKPFVGNSGTYEIKGSMILRHPIVAKNVDVMTSGTPETDEFKLEGTNTLWLKPMNDSMAPQVRVKLIRVE
jgi:hypothetical protein